MTTSRPTIERQRTALRRSTLSRPLQALLRLGFLDGTHSVFDYGCGRGDDLRMLADMGISADGWDPVYRPSGPKRAADIVNLGFVLNVIESPDERRRTLTDSFSLAREFLIASVMLGYQSRREQFAAYQDGIRTQRNTFQKYYTQDEFRSYLESALDAHAIPVAPGVCLVFRDPVDEQLFLLARQQVRRQWRLLRRAPASDAVAAMIDRHREQIDTYWLTALELGRPPSPVECPQAEPLVRLVGPWRRVHGWVSRFFDPSELEAAAIARQEDLLVYFALGHFRRRAIYRQFPDRLKRDVQVFFGNITKARSAGKRALFAAGDAKRVTEAAEYCHHQLNIGRLNDHDFTFHQSVLSDCLPLIRVYVGCALQLFGDAGSVDLIKVHLQSDKVTFLVYDDFRASTPLLVERVKVDLPRLSVDFYDYVGEHEPQPLSEDPSEFYQR
ncbi:MAG: DNA phosphorothioation-associated putative methyltransferase [Acidobacteria bacterium]|nr:DNA phosphorothioation-associated putative methyltransferase [Acidobacteriota bacterium]